MKKSPFLSLVSIPAVLLSAALALASVASGGVPRAISYQGYLTDDAGDPLTGPVNITFRLFAGEGAAIWEESHAAVQLNEGRFAVALGEDTALPADFSQPLFLEIEVNGETLSPRLPLRSAPYALQAGKVDVNGVDSAAVADGAIGKAKLAKDIAGAGLAQNGDGSLRIALAGVGATMIADSAISNQHISSTAAIAPSKINGTAVTLNGSETLTNKTLTNPVLTINDSDLAITDDADPTYSVRLQLTSPRGDRTARTLVVPDADGTLALEGYVQTYVGTQIGALAAVASSGSFVDLADVPDFARRDEGNVFTAAAGAISLEPADALPGSVLLQVMPAIAVRPTYPGPVFTVDAEGDVAGNSFAAVQMLAVEATAATTDQVLLQVMSNALGRTGIAGTVFTVDAEGDVVGNSFSGTGTDLYDLNADHLTSGTVSLDRLPLIPGSHLEYSAVDGNILKDGSVANADVAPDAAIDFSKIDVPDGAVTNNMLLNDSFSVTLDTNLTGSSAVALGGTLDLAVDTTNLSGAMAGWGLMAAGTQLAINNTQLVPSLANDLAGKGLVHDTFDDTLALRFGSGLTLDGTSAVIPNVDDATISINGDGKLAVIGVASVPVVLDTNEPATPQHGSLIFKDGALQVYNDPDGVGGEPGQWLKIGTYQ